MQHFSSYLRILLLLSLLGLSPRARAAERWVTYQNCQLLPNESNDGDSFHVRAEGHEYIFRLYFVDTPETANEFPARVSDQAKYFHLTVPQTPQVGIEAERYTRQKLSQPFTVITCKQGARGQSHLPRYFAVVEIGNENLAEDLVANGLARVYGMTAHAPTLKSPAAEKGQLLQLEASAKSQKLGGWGVREGRLGERVKTSSSSTPSSGNDSFDAFFHPNSTPSPTITGNAATSRAGEKLDVNAASAEALQNLPGIGQVTAKRIIGARPFKSADDLQRVPGIGPRKYEVLRPYFR